MRPGKHSCGIPDLRRFLDSCRESPPSYRPSKQAGNPRRRQQITQLILPSVRLPLLFPAVAHFIRKITALMYSINQQQPLHFIRIFPRKTSHNHASIGMSHQNIGRLAVHCLQQFPELPDVFPAGCTFRLAAAPLQPRPARSYETTLAYSDSSGCTIDQSRDDPPIPASRITVCSPFPITWA